MNPEGLSIEKLNARRRVNGLPALRYAEVYFYDLAINRVQALHPGAAFASCF